MHAIRRQTCRACGGDALTKVIDLGEQHLQGAFFKPGTPAPRRKVPMALVRCNPRLDEGACGLLQAEYSVPAEMMYRSYWYRSGVNQTMRTHLQHLVWAARKFIGRDGVSPPTRVLDIGCNDGTLLNYYPEEYECWGVDPSDVAAKAAALPENAHLHIVNDFFPSTATDAALRDGKPDNAFDIITAVAMFYDLEDPQNFVHNVAAWLAPEGVFIFEMSYMPAMLAQTSYDTVCHEHLEYYSLAVIEHILATAGLQVVHVEQNDINGGSLRCYAVHSKTMRRLDETVMAMRAAEFDLQLDTDLPYSDFQKRAEIHRTDLLALLERLKTERKRVHVYGASTKGNTLLQWCNITPRLVEAAADRNPEKWGALTPGTEIPIISELDSHERRPDYYLVLPWHFRQEFVEREHRAMHLGTKLIFPLPRIEIVGG
jgi:SAM-dependent methyltransferase